MKAKFFAILLLTCIMAASCCKDKDCEKSSLGFTLISFSPTEMDTIIFRRFEAGSNFRNTIDSMFIDNINKFSFYSHGDSVDFGITDTPYFKFRIQPGFDYEIYIPGTNKLVKISDIIEIPTQRNVCMVHDAIGLSHPVGQS